MAYDLISRTHTSSDWSRSSDVGSVLLPDAQEKRLRDKIDDIRYDVRGMRNIVSAAVLSLAAAMAFDGFVKAYAMAPPTEPWL